MNTGKEIECKLCGIFHDADDEWCSLKREEVGCSDLLAEENQKMRDEMKKFCDTFWNASTDNLDSEVMNFLEDWERKFNS